MLKKCFLYSLLFLMIINISSCAYFTIEDRSGTDGKVVKDVFAMDTYMTLTAYGDRAGEAVLDAENKIHELDKLLSVSNPDGDIGRLNSDKKAELSDETMYNIEYAGKINEMTEGAFNPLIYPVMKEWGFDSGNYRVPSKEKLDELLEHIDMDKLIIDTENKNVEYKDKNMQIDLGGIAKGYTSDVIMDIFKEYGLSGGIVSLGGNVQAYGKRPDGEKWKVAVRHPDGKGQLGVVSIDAKAVITSGGYERYFEQDGKNYHHIIDPSTGYPAENGLTSVTIISDSGILADALSTAVYVMGYDRAVKLWLKMSDKFDMILYSDEGKQYVTEGISGDYESSEGESVEVIRK